MADLAPIIEAQLSAEASKPSTDMSQQDVTKVGNAVSKAVNKEVNAIVTNLTNQEPWYKSRIIIGLAVSLLVKAAIIAGWATDSIDVEQLTGQVMLLVSVVGDLYAAYGRAVAQKPIGG